METLFKITRKPGIGSRIKDFLRVRVKESGAEKRGRRIFPLNSAGGFVKRDRGLRLGE
jgi:hypothetical protein